MAVAKSPFCSAKAYKSTIGIFETRMDGKSTRTVPRLVAGIKQVL
jgi:hypothetical protein